MSKPRKPKRKPKPAFDATDPRQLIAAIQSVEGFRRPKSQEAPCSDAPKKNAK